MRRLRARRAAGDRGATLVEFALITPLLFLMLGSMLDLGLAVLGRSVASNAAREGARVGIIQFENANVVGSPSHNAIKAAVDTKLVGLVSPNTSSGPYVEVRCLDGITKLPLVPAGTCARSAVTVDRDLIEVTVRWRSISPAGGMFTPDTYTDRARMVIIGNGGAGGVACVGSGGNIAFSPNSYSQNEGDGPTPSQVTLTVTRSSGLCTTTVGYATVAGSASAGTDYVAVPNGLVTFLAGETSKTFAIDIVGDTVTEPNESFTLTLSNAVNGTITGGTATVNILNDDISTVPPMLTYLRQYDMNGDGRIDRITAGFDEDLQPSCPTPAAFTFPSNPNGVSRSGPVVFSGVREVTVNLNEGTADTSATAVTVALAAGCVRDVDGNSATFGATAPTDLAPPVLLAVVDDDTLDNANNGTLQQNDWVEFRFSEPINPATLPGVTGTVTVLGGTGNGANSADKLGITNVLVGDTNLNSSTYISGNNSTATFPNATITLPGNAIRVTLTNACNAGNCGNLTQGAQAGVTFVFITTITGFDGLPITSTTPISVRLF